MNSVMNESATHTATRNACKLCAPLGAVFVYRGIEGCVPLVHGSQGCSTYIRRYIISHFREPLDVASSNFTESSAIFGGQENLSIALENVIRQYTPAMIGIASTCLSETIGDDIMMYLREFIKEHQQGVLPDIVYSSTPSYRGTHMDGFHQTVAAVARYFAAAGERLPRINILPGFVSAEDMRSLKQLLPEFGVDFTMLPDYSESLDGQSWDEYQVLPPGGTPTQQLRLLGRAGATVEFGFPVESAAAYLEKQFGVERINMELPVGLKNTDRLVQALCRLSGRDIPVVYAQQRGRLLDSYVDAHKITFEKQALVYGEEDMVVALAGFLDEIGMVPAVCATGSRSGRLLRRLQESCPQTAERITAWEGVDYMSMAEQLQDRPLDMLIGNSKGYYLSRNLHVPLVRVGFPIHDRIGGQRILQVGYAGAQQLFDRIVNALLEARQEESGVGYMYY